MATPDPSTQRYPIDLLKVKNILQDGDLYLALLPLLAYFDPKLAHFIVNNWPILSPYILVLIGRLGIRITGVHATGKTLAAAVPQFSAAVVDKTTHVKETE